MHGLLYDILNLLL